MDFLSIAQRSIKNSCKREVIFPEISGYFFGDTVSSRPRAEILGPLPARRAT